MNLVELLRFAGYLEILVCLAALAILLARGLWQQYTALGWFLAVRGGSRLALALILLAGPASPSRTAYHFYFYIYWVSFAVEAVLGLWMLFGIFRSTLKPLEGLRSLGSVLLWALVVLAVMRGLDAQSALHRSGFMYLSAVVSRLHRGESLVTLCVAAVVFAVFHAVGLSYRSREFGLTLGLGLLATADLLAAGMMSIHPATNAGVTLLNTGVFCVAMAIWMFYLALPEPRRESLHLPPNSPLLQWNRIVLNWSDVI